MQREWPCVACDQSIAVTVSVEDRYKLSVGIGQEKRQRWPCHGKDVRKTHLLSGGKRCRREGRIFDSLELKNSWEAFFSCFSSSVVAAAAAAVRLRSACWPPREFHRFCVESAVYTLVRCLLPETKIDGDLVRVLSHTAGDGIHADPPVDGVRLPPDA